MATSFNKETDELAIELLQQLLALGIDVDLQTSDVQHGFGRTVTRDARVSWQTHNADATPLKRR